VHRLLADMGMAELFWPTRLELAPALPKTPTGKVRKVEVQRRFAGS
jgi:cyclohexanecarboxylate-CoA ligase